MKQLLRKKKTINYPFDGSMCLHAPKHIDVYANEWFVIVQS